MADINNLMPGGNDPFTYDGGDSHRTMDEEGIAIERANELGFFHMLQPHFNQEHINEIDKFVVEAPARIKQRVVVDNVAGLLSGTAVAVQVPESCRWLKVETSGRVWISQSPQNANGSQTLSQAVDSRSVAIVGNGYPKLIRKPVGVGTLYFSAYPDNSEVAVAFISGEVEFKDLS